MVKKSYNKLVRDKIPEIIEKNGSKCTCRTLSEETYLDCLDTKLFEEVTEYDMDKSKEEIADILEVLMAIAKARGYEWSDIIAIQEKKREERGGFEQRILLIETED
ncbi:MAG: nucleoside triphosphate pyrophosphohydrolase [Agathobacter sp.]|nr:nucleoside triphosphate pyrophosphohydrolase [Agathobacter sp.]